ncbi:MAG: hypothetical protein AABW72_01165 [archaeon]
MKIRNILLISFALLVLISSVSAFTLTNKTYAQKFNGTTYSDKIRGELNFSSDIIMKYKITFKNGIPLTEKANQTMSQANKFKWDKEMDNITIPLFGTTFTLMEAYGDETSNMAQEIKVYKKIGESKVISNDVKVVDVGMENNKYAAWLKVNGVSKTIYDDESLMVDGTGTYAGQKLVIVLTNVYDEGDGDDVIWFAEFQLQDIKGNVIDKINSAVSGTDLGKELQQTNDKIYTLKSGSGSIPGWNIEFGAVTQGTTPQVKVIKTIILTK